MHTDYGFNIPSTATVTGIKATMAYNASGFVNGTLKDSVCTLLLNGNLIGDDHCYQTSWYTGTGTVSFGGPGDLWGQAVVLTPYNISSPGFGFNFKLFSAVGNATFTVLNGVEITIYYADISGINESQTSSSDIKIINWQDHLSFDGLDGTEELEIFDINGRCLLIASQPIRDVDVSSLQSGIYFCHLKRNNSSQIRKILVQHQ